MTTCIAFLRGINVGGKNRLPMKDLSLIFEAAGCDNVRTYIQSGNVVFNSPAMDASDLAVRVKKEIETRHGFTPPIFLLRPDELREVVGSNPYPEAVSEPKSLHLVFLDEVPQGTHLDSLNELRSDRESFLLVGKTLFIHAPDGIARSKLFNGVEKVLQVTTTARNWRTVANVLELASEIE